MSKNTNIDNFNGYFEFLNNDFSTWVLFEGQLYPSVTTAFQAARTDDLQIRNKILNAESYDELADIARSVKNPPEWSSRRYKVMEALIRDKFHRNKQIRQKLVMTENRKIINTYPKGGDNELYWGTVDGQGSNCQGKILETVRHEIIKEIDLQKWLNDFHLEKDHTLYPKVSIIVKKNDEPVQKLFLQNKNYFTFGSLKTNSFPLDHPSISRSHAVTYFNNQSQVYIVDLNSTAGTILNGIKLEPNMPTQLKSNDEIIFGMSSRKYVIQIDITHIANIISRRSQEAKKQINQIQNLSKDISTLTNQEIRNQIGFKVTDHILVENLPYNTSTRRLQQLFAEYAKIHSVNICIDNKTGRDVGIAIVRVKHQNEAKQMIQKGFKIELSGRTLNLKLISQNQAEKILQSYSVQERKAEKKERKRSRSRSRSNEKKKNKKH